MAQIQTTIRVGSGRVCEVATEVVKRKVIFGRSLCSVDDLGKRLVGAGHCSLWVEPVTLGRPADVNGTLRVKVTAVHVSREAAWRRLRGEESE